MTDLPIIPSLFDFTLSDEIDHSKTIDPKRATRIFKYFAANPLFSWERHHNGCEARADAVCVLLDEWEIPNYKAWVFSGRYLKKHVGALKKNWKYHVAATIPVMDEGSIVLSIIDPSTAEGLQTLYEWAANVTEYAHSYHFITQGNQYIFHDQKIKIDNWHKRNRRNRKWMIQGLANINGLSAAGKAQLAFNKGRIKNTARAFQNLFRQTTPV